MTLRLSSTRRDFASLRGDALSVYRVELPGRGSLIVRTPAKVTLEQTLEIVAQLRELADSLMISADLLRHESAVREELLRTSELLRASHANVTDLHSARDLLEFYGSYREAVVEYLRCAPD